MTKPKAAVAAPAARKAAVKRAPSSPSLGGQFQPVRTRRVFEEICDAIRRKMVAGEIKAGDRLPAERDLAEMLAVSRTALREALRSLEIAGIVVLKKGSKGGAFITEGGAGQVTQTFRDMMDFGRVSLADLLDARLLVMDVVVRTACELAGPTDLERLRQNLAETVALSKAGRHEERTLKAVEFSTILADATGNPVISAILEAMASVIRGFVLLAGPMAHEGVVASRRRLIEQMERRDTAGAQTTMRTYLTNLNTYLLDAERGRHARGPHRSSVKRSGKAGVSIFARG